MRNTTLCYLEQNDKYLMLLRNKKEIDENKGKWIGVGGKLEEGESPEECLVREVKEETGLTLKSYRLRGIITFVSDEWGCEIMHLYTADSFVDENGKELLNNELTDFMKNCNEGELSWIDKSKILNLNLWEGDITFLRMLIDDAPMFSMKVVYEGDKLIFSDLISYE